MEAMVLELDTAVYPRLFGLTAVNFFTDMTQKIKHD
jgi:hypothetical protein